MKNLLLKILFLTGSLLACGCETKPAPPMLSPVRSDSRKIAPSVEETLLEASPAPAPPNFGLRFEVARDCGIDFVHYGNPSPEHYMTEQNGGGGGLFDFDLDGWVDLFLANGSHFDRPAEQAAATHKLYRNISDANDELQFLDVTAQAGLGVSGFGMGVAAADYNNDGFPDLLVCEYGRVRLWENLGDGTWLESTKSSQFINDAWASSAAWADLDEDGDLDLYITNYVEYSSSDPPCFTQHARPVQISCGPIGRIAQADNLWMNSGDGTFVEASQAAGLRLVESGKGLAVEIVDLDGDHRLDIYVSNDTTQNFLYKNQPNHQFTEVGLITGTGFGSDGGASSSMGTACADFDKNGRFDLFVTNFENSINDYYSNHSTDVFFHASSQLGLDTPSRPMLAFGTIAADFNLDRWPDLFVANGHIWDLQDLGFGHQYEMTPQLFLNQQGHRFVDASSQAGSFFQEKWLGRSAAVGDLDNDGDADFIVTNQLKKTAVVLNQSQRQGKSMSLKFIGKQAARLPLGVRVTCRFADEVDHYHIPSGGSFAATHDPRLLISVAEATKIDELIIHWQSESAEVWLDVPVQVETYFIEGTGTAITKSSPERE